MKIGIFDSGVGGKSVARAIERSFPNDTVIFRSDVDHLPYGTKPPTEIFLYVLPILKSMVEGGCVVIIVACNTVSTTLITKLRKHVAVPLIAVEPMVKPAALATKTGVIAVCATPTTLASKRYAWLKQTYAESLTVIEPDCSRWSYLIERQILSEAEIAVAIEAAIDFKADVIVLGCTHYHWIEDEIVKIAAGRAKVIQPEQAVIRQLKRVLARLA